MISISSLPAKRAAFLLSGLVFGISFLIQIILLTDYYLHSPFYSGLICDSTVYYKWAENILNSGWLGQEVFHQAPLYPYFMAFLWLIFGQHYLVIYLSQAFMMAFSALLVFLICRQYCPNFVALAAGLLCAFYGALNFYALKILPDILGVVLLLWLAYLLLNAAAPRQWAGAGCVCGLLIIGRPHVMLLVPMVLFWIMIFTPGQPEKTVPSTNNIRARLKHYGYFLLPIIILVGLVTWRNYLIEPALVLVSSNGGENFYMGNNPRANGVYCRMDGISPDIKYQKIDVKDVAEAKTGRVLTGAAVSQYWLAQGLAFIRNNFPQYLRLELTKLKRMFSGTEYTNMYFLWFERAEFTKTLAVPLVNFYVILPLAIIGALLFNGQWRQYSLLYMMILLTVLSMLIFYVDERYRLPMIPFLIIMGTGGVYRLLEILRTGACPIGRKIGIAVLVIAAFSITIHLYRSEPARLPVAPQLYNNLGEVYCEKHEYQKALNIFYKSSRMAANNWEAEIGVAKVLFALGKKDIAVKLYQEAYPNLDKDMQTTVLRDHDLEALRQHSDKSRFFSPGGL